MSAAPVTDGAGRPFRSDIDGLRAVAIVLVVAYHMGLSSVSGGFIGVDVFFVISGFLITRNLLTETRGTGEVDLLGFWGKRMRRLVPALALMIVVVLGLALLVLPVLEWQAVADEGRAAALYVSNIYFADQATDYFGGEVANSLFLHTWSLGVEEQFYLVWPLLFAGACLLVRRRPARLRLVLASGFVITLVVSMAVNLRLIDRSPAWVFFGLPARAWEFAAAGLLAMVPLSRLRHGRAASSVAAAVGLAMIGWAAVTLSEATAYPGTAALLPVVGTVLVIVAGSSPEAANPVSRALAVRPGQWLGRVSYSWYLWHWPLILLAVIWLEDDGLRVTAGAAAVSLAVATAAHHLVENPLRFSPALTRSVARTFLAGGAITGVALLATVGVIRYADDEINTTADLATLDEVRAARKNFDCPRERRSDSGIDYCEAGDPDGADTIVLMGDSHTRHWTPAFIEAAESEGYRLVIRWRGACPSTNVAVASARAGAGSGVDPECTAFQHDTDALVDEIDPDVVVLSNTSVYIVDADTPIEHPDGQAGVWEDGLRERVRKFQQDGRSVALVVDTPRFTDDPVECLAEAESADECDVPLAEAFLPRAIEVRAAEQRVADDFELPQLDVLDQLCPDGLCVMRIDGQYVYSDKEHLYDGFVTTFTPEVVEFLSEARSRVTRED